MFAITFQFGRQRRSATRRIPGLTMRRPSVSTSTPTTWAGSPKPDVAGPTLRTTIHMTLDRHLSWAVEITASLTTRPQFAISNPC